MPGQFRRDYTQHHMEIARKGAGLTVDALVERVGCTRSYYYAIMRRTRWPSLEMRRRLAGVLGLPETLIQTREEAAKEVKRVKGVH